AEGLRGGGDCELGAGDRGRQAGGVRHRRGGADERDGRAPAGFPGQLGAAGRTGAWLDLRAAGVGERGQRCASPCGAQDYGLTVRRPPGRGITGMSLEPWSYDPSPQELAEGEEFWSLPEEVRRAALEYARGVMIAPEPEPLPDE